METSTFLLIIEIIGTVAFAISGIRLAAAKDFDWFGAYVVGLVTAIGGGTLRDILLDATPFWMGNPWYVSVTGLSLLYVILFRKLLVKLNSTFFFFDTIGLALFVVIGIQKTLLFDYPMWVAIIMGTITGALGGVIRDILINEEPLIFRKDVYVILFVLLSQFVADFPLHLLRNEAIVAVGGGVADNHFIRRVTLYD